MIFFSSDYSQGAHPRVMEALMNTNLEHSDGYGMDAHCGHAARMSGHFWRRSERYAGIDMRCR